MINSLGEVVMPESDWTNWQIHVPESLLTDSTYVGFVHGFIFTDTKSICIVDDPLYFSPERIVGYIGTSAPVWPNSVSENYSKNIFFTGRFADEKIEGYVISNNTAFGAHPLTAHTNNLKSLPELLEIIQARELEEIGKATIIPYSLNNIVHDCEKSWIANVPESILSNPGFCGAIYGMCRDNSIFVYDTITFPEWIEEKNRIGVIWGEAGDTAAKISMLRWDGNDIIEGEYIDSILRLRLIDEGINSDGTCWDKQEHTRIVIHKRQEEGDSTHEAVAALRFQLSTTHDIIEDFDGTVLNPADPMSASSLANGDGFKPVDAIIEPWFTPFWSFDSILEQIHQTNSVSISRMYRDLLELIKEFPIFEYIGDKLGVRLMDIESIKEALKIFPEDFVRMVADYYAEKHKIILIDGNTTTSQDAASDFISGIQLLKKLTNDGHIHRNTTTAEAIASMRAELTGNYELSEEFSGFKPVDPCIEPWHVLPWKRENLLKAIQEEEQRVKEGNATDCMLNHYKTQLERIKKYPVLEYVGERIKAPIMDSKDLERWASLFSDDVLKSVVDYLVCSFESEGSTPQIEYIIGGMRLLEMLLNSHAVDLTKILGET